MILKPGKPPELATSYRPISLLQVLSKVFQALLLKRLKPLIIEKNIMPDHQFGFRQHYSIIGMVNRVYVITRKPTEEKIYSAVFLGISQAFDKV